MVNTLTIPNRPTADAINKAAIETIAFDHDTTPALANNEVKNNNVCIFETPVTKPTL